MHRPRQVSLWSMSIFVRPESPPPRQPSPDITPAPLPYPHHPRRVASQPKIRVCSPSPSRPPGLQSPPTRTLQSARSYDHMMQAHSDHNAPMTPRRRALPTSRTRRSGPHRLALTRRSSIHVCPVANSPLPPAPASLSSKRILRPQPISFDSLYLPHKDEIDPNALTQPKPSTNPVILPPLQKHQGLGMACLRFFRFRNSCTSKAT